MKTRKLICSILSMAVILTSIPFAMPVHASAEEPQSALPAIVLTTGEGQPTPSYNYGETKDLTIHVKNTGMAPANNVVVTPQLGSTTEEWPFEIASMDNNLNLGTIPPGETRDIVYSLTARQDVANQYYKLNFHLQFDDSATQYTTDKYIFVKMQAKPAEPTKPEEEKPEKDPAPSQDPTASGDTGGSTAGSYDDSYSAASYDGGSGGGISNSGSSESGSVPRVIVTGFSTNPGVVKAGDNFTLQVVLKNTSPKTEVKNMVVSFEAPAEGSDANTSSAAFLPVSGASTIYVDKIKANAETTVSLDFNAKNDLVQKPYSISLTMKYEDKNSQQYDSASSVAIPIKQDPRFEFSKIQVNPTAVQIGQDANINCSLYNLGKIKLYNLKVKVANDYITSQEAFIGNVESGATAAIDMMITGQLASEGEKEMELVCTYEDVDGKETTVTQPFTLEVVEADEMDMTDMDMTDFEPEETSGFSWTYVYIAIGIVAIGVVTFLIIRKKKRAKADDELF